MTIQEAHKLQDNEDKHQEYINGFEDGLTYRRWAGEEHEIQEIWKDKQLSKYYLNGLIEAVGYDPRY
jgi:hypothetical protein